MEITLLWALCVILIVLGLAGTVLPVLPGTLLVGAAGGEYLARKDHTRAAKIGVATWVGIMVGLVAKVVLSFIMVGIFAAALLF